jgi:hypothetical protein
MNVFVLFIQLRLRITDTWKSLKPYSCTGLPCAYGHGLRAVAALSTRPSHLSPRPPKMRSVPPTAPRPIGLLVCMTFDVAPSRQVRRAAFTGPCLSSGLL